MPQYSIGDISRILDVKPYVLRYWEQEMPVISPEKNETGKRVYSGRDLDLLFRIKFLLYEKRFTIEGVKMQIMQDAEKQNNDLIARIRALREGLVQTFLKIKNQNSCFDSIDKESMKSQEKNL